MLTEYIQAALRHAQFKQLEDGSYFGEIPELPGVWSNAPVLLDAMDELRSVLEEWIAFRLSRGKEIPAIDGKRIAFTEISAPAPAWVARIGPIKHADLVQNLRRLGFTGPYGGGRHLKMDRDDLTITIPNPHHGDIGEPLLREFLRQTGLRDEWDAL
jgi:predicted RNase H-like HicB family nuclease